jgi:hypothetical protein
MLISSGPVLFEAADIRVISPEETLARFLNAQEGENIPLKMHCDGPSRLISLRPTAKVDPRAVFSLDGSQTRKSE